MGPEIVALDERTRDAIVSDVATALSGYRDEGRLLVCTGWQQAEQYQRLVNDVLPKV